MTFFIEYSRRERCWTVIDRNRLKEGTHAYVKCCLSLAEAKAAAKKHEAETGRTCLPGVVKAE